MSQMSPKSTNDLFEGLWITGEAHLGTGRRSHPRAGSVVTVFADRGVRLCDPVLLANGGGSKWTEAIALGVVIGEALQIGLTHVVSIAVAGCLSSGLGTWR